MRLINADALIKTIGSHCYPVRQENNSIEPGMTLVGIIQAVQEQPTIEPEHKRGKWVPVDSFSAFGGDQETWMAHGNPAAFHYCSECKMQAHVNEFGEELLTSFCPDCGADMTVEDTNEQTD